MDYERCYAPSWGRHLDRTLPVIGNHEWGTAGAAGYFGYFGERVGDPRAGWYATDLGAWRIIVLASDCGRVGGCGEGSPQGRWLARELADHARACTLALWHHPLFSSGHHGPTREVEPFWRMLHAAGADLVVNAHEHSYERFERLDPDGRPDAERGIRQIVVGTGGGELRGFSREAAGSEVRLSTHGVLRLDLHEGSYDWTFVPVTPGADGDADAGSDECH
jgi:hypothetical protein